MATTTALEYRRPFFDPDDRLFARCLTTSAIAALVLVIAVRLLPAPPPRAVTHVEELPQRFARLILEPAKKAPPPPIVQPLAERAHAAEPKPVAPPGGGGGGGGEAKPTHKPVPLPGAPAGNRPVEAMHSLASGGGEAGRARAQAEVQQQLASSTASLKSALAGLTASLGVTSSAAGGSVVRGGRSRGIRDARGSGELGSANATLSGDAVAGARAELAGSAVAGKLVSIGELAAGPGWGTGSGPGVGTGSGGGIGSGKGTGVGSGSGPGVAGGGASPGVYRSNASLLAVIQRYSAGIQYCYGNELKRDPTLRGKLVVAITVAASGEVTEATVVQNTTGSSRLASCALSQVRDWRFPAITGGATTFQAPFVFTPPS